MLSLYPLQNSFILFSVTILTSTNDALLYEKSLVTTVNTVPPLAVLEGVSKSGVDDDLVLSAARSSDPNKDLNGISYVWTCHDVRILINYPHFIPCKL